MKKTLLLGAALVVGVAGYSQSTAKKVVNQKFLQKQSNFERVAIEPKSSSPTGVKIAKRGNGYQSVSSSCSSGKKITTSWNCFGVGGGSTTGEQNCLSYNKDLNAAIWTQRGSKQWSVTTTSGFIQSTIINATTLATDSVITYKDAGVNDARYPGGTFLNPTGNTDYHHAFAVASGPTVPSVGTKWSGTAYTAKPLWSTSAMNHNVAEATDSLWSSTATGALFPHCAGTNVIGVPNTDMTTLPDGKTVLVIGQLASPADIAINETKSDYLPAKKAMIGRGTLDATGKIVNWTVDTSIAPDVYKSAPAGGDPSLGWTLSSPRMAFGPDGMHGYVLFLGKLNTNYGNSSDSAMTPIVYKTTDAGLTWTQVLAGYDWVCKHPEVLRNVGQLTGKMWNYSFNPYEDGADITVDANNVMHYVTSVAQPFGNGNYDSVGVYTYSYNYDDATAHSIIWDFMTDGNEWKTMMVDSTLSAALSSSTSDTTSTYSPMNGTQTLGVNAHLTVSRATDGSKVFYGWADSDPNILGANATGATYNTSPDILMKAYDVQTNKVTATKNITNTGKCFYPYLSDISYYDAAQSAWVTPAVYTKGNDAYVITASPVILYDASSQADYYYTNCGTFANAEFSSTPWIYAAPAGTVCATNVGIAKINAFASSISNFPNPFSNNTTIAVTLSEAKTFDVKVYNTIGTLVFSKNVNGNVGENNVTFDAGSLSSGVYYYT
ncbi:MAG: T9SS type A sorting domain-containing protein, partial [Bacteroidia bacterium]